MDTSSAARRTLQLLLLLVTIALLSGCERATTDDPEQGERLLIIASTSIIADVARNVSGDAAEIVSLIPTGADPHSYQLTPGDATKIAEADLILVNGFGLEGGLLQVIESSSGPSSPVDLSAAIEGRQAGLLLNAWADDGHDPRTVPDPHVWMNPRNVISWIEIIVDELERIDPESGDQYSMNGQDYINRLNTLDSQIEDDLAAIPAAWRILVSDHDSMGYFADRYGLEPVGAPLSGGEVGGLASARDLAELSDYLREKEIRAIFVARGSNQDVGRQIAGDAGVQLVELWIGALGGEGSGAESYVALMEMTARDVLAALR